MVKGEIATISNELASIKRGIKSDESRLERIKLKREKIFHKLMDGQISDDEYVKLSRDVERDQIMIEDVINVLKKNMKNVLAKKKEKVSTIDTYKEVKLIREINRDVVDKFINKITICEEERIVIMEF